MANPIFLPPPGGVTLRRQRHRSFTTGGSRTGNFVPTVRLDSSQVRDLRGKTQIRGRSLRAVLHMRVHRGSR